MTCTSETAPESESKITARRSAASHRISGDPPDQLPIFRSMSSLSDWLERLLDYCSDPAPGHRRAADWLLDNDYQVARAIRRLKEDLPPRFYMRLRAVNDEFDGRVPRAFAVAATVLDETQPAISFRMLVDFVNEYQAVASLDHGELWALPSMLRLVCLEKLGHAFAQLDHALAPPFDLSRFSAAGNPAEAGDPTARIASAIGNLAAVHAIKWPDLVDRTSPIDAILNHDPAKVYATMTFDTRERYRKAVERLAFRSDRSEPDVARATLDMARGAAGTDCRDHVGYWLIDKGLAALEASLGYRSTGTEVIRRQLARRSGALYAAGLGLGVVVALLLPVIYLYANDAMLAQWIVGVALALLPATVLSVSLAHWLITLVVPPQTLPELDFATSIPEDFATAVVVPVIVAQPQEVRPILEKLEMRRLSNPDPALRFVLLSDPGDAAAEHLPSDRQVETELVDGIRRLNARYPDAHGGPFFLLHRTRRYNPCEKCWMAWERKRGKLEEFNRLVLGDDSSNFALTEGPVARLRQVRFAITLDADTGLPPGAAARLIGCLAHPLSRARFDPGSGQPVAGYSILQPRIEMQPGPASATLFSHIYAGDSAIDIYSRAVSDVYQDLFGTGIFVGKGIYDIASVQRSLAERVPENSILSHDLFEGIHSRAALASNIVLYEGFPGTYLEFAMRSHRWQRGDWQLMPWLGRTVPSADGTRMPNPLSALDRWKIVDNLRRSLIAPALLLFLIGGWTVLPGSPALWTLLALAAPGSYLIGEVVNVATGGIRRGRLTEAVHRFSSSGGRWLFSIVFLVSDTLIALDAVFRTLWRLMVSKSGLMEWKSAAHASADLPRNKIRPAAWSLMWPSSAMAFVIGTHLGIFDLSALLAAAPVLTLWLAAPEIAIWTARRRRFRRDTLDEAQRDFLVGIARRTWHFFETFAGPDDNWLPPDNFQDFPTDKIAHRTSPTNVGMYLTAALAARDLGFIANSEFLIRCQNTVTSLDRMKRYRGHVLNWYDTRSLDPLEPQYVSTVDSGNLAVAMIALKHGCLEIANSPAVPVACLDGLEVVLDLSMNAARGLSALNADALTRIEGDIRKCIRQARTSPASWRGPIGELSGRHWTELERIVGQAIAQSDDIQPGTLTEIHVWLDRFHHHLIALLRDSDRYLPWLALLDRAPAAEGALVRDVARQLSPQTETAAILKHAARIGGEIDRRLAGEAHDTAIAEWLTELRRSIAEGAQQQDTLYHELVELAERANGFAYGMEFGFLYNPEARLFSIGYNLGAGQMDANHYDLLATEARLASFFAIAKQDVPVEHWFSFSRPITRLKGKPLILSWNGSMFEYLMPPIFLPSRRDTLLGESELTAVQYQQRYAAERGVPWGISESAFSATDSEGNYQYRAFGVPGLGIRRGLTRDLVVAPYATALALCVQPGSAVENLRRLAQLGAVTCYGFIEALDFTPSRISRARAHVPVQTHMAHHQGMTIAAIINALAGDVLVRRVAREKSLKAMDLLLDEQVPWDVPIDTGRADEAWERHADTHAPTVPPPWVPSLDASSPQMHLLGNGRLSTLVSASGGGGLSWQGNALTRWRSDPTQNDFGSAVYFRDTDSGALWSAGRFPTGIPGQDARTLFHQHMVETFRRDHGIATRMELTVAPFADAEVRRFTLINDSDQPRNIELTSYAEIVLAPPLDDERHPAFSKLFVRSSFLNDHQALLFQRRPRRPEAVAPVLLQKFLTEEDVYVSGFETDRGRFIGRNGNLKSPDALGRGLGGSEGWTLDPIASLQLRLRLKPMQKVQVALVTISGTSRGEVLETASQFTMGTLDRVFREAALETAREVQNAGVDLGQLPALQVLSSLLLQPNPVLRHQRAGNLNDWNGQPDLWRFGISGDHPLLLFLTDDARPPENLDVLVRAKTLWHRRGLAMDLVVLRQGASSYEGPLRERILSVLRDTHSEGLLGRDGGIHLLSSDQMSVAARRGLEAAAQVVLTDDPLMLTERLDRVLETRRPPPRFEPAFPVTFEQAQDLPRPGGLAFDNGYGGFDAETGEYVIHLTPGMRTPAPWCNVLANDGFGTIVSEAGLGFSWAVNSGEHRLTPWSNDPVADEANEVLYLRDEASAEVWTPTPAPLGHDTTCQVRHGFGYTRWTRNSQELRQECTVLVPPDAPVKLVRIRLGNVSDQARRITATYYAEWLLGALASVAKPHVVCSYDPQARAILARNPWNPEFAGRVAFLTASSEPHSVTGLRRDFLGPEGDLSAPDALARWDLGGRFVPGGDACAAYQVHLEIAPQGTTEVVFVLGEAEDTAAATDLIRVWRKAGAFDAALSDVQAAWRTRSAAVRVRTPDPALDLMVNHWLPYQNLSCRVLARAGFYQAGGAFGFRDQLQDMLALLHSDPARVRAHILNAARHQFEAGDVLHWWHPPEGRGVKTRCSDDYLWLVYVTARYVRATGDRTILADEVPFLVAPDLRDDEDDRYARYDIGETAPLIEHCARALDRMMATGAHGLPLIGTGDWNDGMDRVGAAGKGESIWLAWFQIATVRLFAPLVAGAELADRAERWQAHAKAVAEAVEEHGWDDEWYLRAFDDAGLPWGSHTNDECRIDLIAQAWSVLSGAPTGDRAAKSLEAAHTHLLDAGDRLIRLLDPPFHETERDPGYIRAYPPGIRENGGQYTHAAAWLGHAFAAVGDGDRAWEVFDIINPIRRGTTAEEADLYKREPYVLAGDVSATGLHHRQGGWSWYTGAAGWTWQLAVTGILGVDLRGATVGLNPCLPKAWGGAEVHLESPHGALSITIRDPGHLGSGAVSITVNGEKSADGTVRFPGAGKTLQVVVDLGE
ncbi:MAG: glucoamylase family protein [Silicimonas sp.]